MLVLVAAMPVLAVAAGIAVAVAEIRSPWSAVVQLVWIPPFLVLASVIMDGLDVGKAWQFEIEETHGLQLEVLLYHSAAPPFGRYVVRVNGEVRLKTRGNWGKTERLEVEVGNGRQRRAVVVVYGRNLWPFRQLSLELDVDGRRLTVA